MNYTVKHTGIMFQGDMMLAYLDNRKNQTRRAKGLQKINEKPDAWELIAVTPYGATFSSLVHKKTKTLFIKTPYGGKGDQLYFKETWKMWEHDYDGKDFLHYRADDAKVDPTWWTEEDWTRPDPVWAGRFDKWQSSMFMPRICARFREIPILRVRVERLYDITESDAVNEGWSAGNPFPHYSNFHVEPARQWYFDLFAKINGKELTNKNPWVFVYEFPKHGAEK
jgi:hypothetical protein